MIVKARINDVPMSLIVDTGATLVVLSPQMAKKAHIDVRHSKKIMLQTANGLTSAPWVHIKRMELDKLHQNRVEAAIQRVSSNPDIGLLGMSFLSAYHISIDHQRQIITLEAR